jgi:hypothetical protein
MRASGTICLTPSYRPRLRLAAVERETDVWQTMVGPPGTATAAPCTTSAPGGCTASAHSHRKMRQQIESRAQLCRAAIKPRQLAIADRLALRAAAEDRAGDDARRRLLIDHQPGADREKRTAAKA